MTRPTRPAGPPYPDDEQPSDGSAPRFIPRDTGPQAPETRPVPQGFQPAPPPGYPPPGYPPPGYPPPGYPPPRYPPPASPPAGFQPGGQEPPFPPAAAAPPQQGAAPGPSFTP